jgi:Transposase DDE domain
VTVDPAQHVGAQAALLLIAPAPARFFAANDLDPLSLTCDAVRMSPPRTAVIRAGLDLENRVRCRLAAGGRWIRTSGSAREALTHPPSFRLGRDDEIATRTKLKTKAEPPREKRRLGYARVSTYGQPRAEEWLLIEWPQGEPEPTKYWLSTMPNDIAFDRLVDLAKLRWRIERDYQELKQELGFGDYEGRGWRGFHHHATLCIAAYGFLIAERGALSPSGPPCTPLLSGSALPDDYRPRGAADPCRTRSQPSADVLSSPSPGPSRDAPVAMRQSEKPAKFPITDAVRLRGLENWLTRRGSNRRRSGSRL